MRRLTVAAARALVVCLVVLLPGAVPAAAQAEISLAWDAPASSGVVAYVVEWGLTPGTYMASASVDASRTAFTATGLWPGLRYYFAVRALDASGASSQRSNEASAIARRVETMSRATSGGHTWPTVALAVHQAGSGSGTVAGTPADVTCGPPCQASLPLGTPVVLVATADEGSRFVGWQGAGCRGDGSCTFMLTTASAVTAIFESTKEPGVAYTRFLAEGASSGTFTTRIALANPGARATTALLQFLRGDGVVIPQTVTVPSLSSVHVDADDVPGLAGAAFATTIESDMPLVVDRTMSWRGLDGALRGAHAESSLDGPAMRWYLAEGATHSGFDLFYLLQNPTTASVRVRVRYLRANGAPLEKTYDLAPLSRTNIWVDHEVFDASGRRPLEAAEVSAVIDVLDGPGIVVERARYDSHRGRGFEAGHASAGATAAATRWYFAEGATGQYFDLFLLLANPGARAADVRVTYLLPDASRVTRTHVVGPQQRYTIWVDKDAPALVNTAVSAVVESTNGVPIVAERSMWWPGDANGWFEAHNAAGATVAATRWAVADGDVLSAGLTRSTYLLVANPDREQATVRMTVLMRPGVPPVSREFQVAAGSRFGISLGHEFPEVDGESAGALIESVGRTPVPIVVERAMYGDAPDRKWARGTALLATRLN
ncbi:MAG: fibronectin type III domain-containing protein [Acidobacteria bacterium]|nr:fibronectin type III domain-containing protein [Acidobacteriota bacterium]